MEKLCLIWFWLGYVILENNSVLAVSWKPKLCCPIKSQIKTNATTGARLQILLMILFSLYSNPCQVYFEDSSAVQEQTDWFHLPIEKDKKSVIIVP